MNRESFEEIVKWKAERMAKAKTLREQAEKMNCEWKVFKIGGWDAMIFDVARSLDLPAEYSTRDYRRNLIEQWLEEGLGE